MNRRVLILLILIVVLIGGGAALYFLVLNPSTGTAPAGGGTTPGNGQQASTTIQTPTPVAVTGILVAIQSLPRGIRIPENGIDVAYFPVGSVPAYALTADQKNAVIGKIARSTIDREQPILSTMLTDDLTKLAEVGSDAGATVPTGLRAIAIPMDRNTMIAYAPRDGDYVDVIGSFLFTDVDQDFQSSSPNTLSFTVVKQDGTISIVGGLQGRLEPSSFSQYPVVTGPSEAQRPRLTTQTMIQSALVVHVGNFPLEGHFVGVTPTPLVQPTDANASSSGSNATQGPPPPTPTIAYPDVITVAVTPQEANLITWMIDQHVPMTLTLRNARDLAKQPTTATTLRYVVENYQVTFPTKLPYALEPALRSIRELTIGTLVGFPVPNAPNKPQGQ